MMRVPGICRDEEREQTNVWRLQRLRHMQRALEPDQVRLEVFSNGDLSDRRADGGGLYAVRFQGLAGTGELLIVEVEDVGVPYAADLDMTDAQVTKGRTLHLKVR